MKQLLPLVQSIVFAMAGLILPSTLLAQSVDFPIAPFDKIITGPRVELDLVQGDYAEAEFEFDNIDPANLNVEVNRGVLRIYLDGARNVEKQRKYRTDRMSYKEGIYRGGRVIAHVTYQTLNKLIVKGEEDVRISGNISDKTFKLKVYGDSDIAISQVNTERLKVKMYGDCRLTIDAGTVERQKMALYGEHMIDLENLDGRKLKVTSFGDSEFRVGTEAFKVTALGEVDIHLGPGTDIRKFILGESRVKRSSY